MDYFLYSGIIDRDSVFSFMELVEETQNSSDVTLVLSTNGGDPDSAYKMGLCLQNAYEENFRILIPGKCKSAGTLLAIAAKELVLSTYHGELGPLDVQRTKKDNIIAQESGLIIHEAFNFLEERAQKVFYDLVPGIIGGSEGNISFQAASDCIAKFVPALFDPVFAKMDPKEIGEYARSMKIAKYYGERLDLRFNNLKKSFPNKSHVLDFLTWSCPSHGCVIGINEVCALFERVRATNESEESIIKEYRLPKMGKPIVENMTNEFQKIETKKVKGSRRNSRKSKTLNGKSRTAQTTTNKGSEES